MDLASLPVGATAQITALDVSDDPGVTLRVRELGLRVGAVVRVLHHAAFGGRVVCLGAGAPGATGHGARGAHGTVRLGLDASTARHVRVVTLAA